MPVNCGNLPVEMLMYMMGSRLIICDWESLIHTNANLPKVSFCRGNSSLCHLPC